MTFSNFSTQSSGERSGTEKGSETVRNSTLGFRSDSARIAVCTIASFDCIYQNPSRFLSLMLIKVIVPHIPDPVNFLLRISRQNNANLKFKMSATRQKTSWMFYLLNVPCFKGGLPGCFLDSTPISHHQYQKRKGTRWGEYVFSYGYFKS